MTEEFRFGKLFAMNKIIGVVVVPLVIGAVAAVAFVAMNKAPGAPKKQSAPVVEAVFPPADARYLDAEASSSDVVMFSVSSHRREADQEAAEAQLVGLWVPSTGWEGEVADLTDESQGFAVRLFVTTGGITGGYYIVAVVPEEPDDTRKGDRATVQGRIDKVGVLPGSMTPIYRIVLSPAKVIGHQKFRR